jgi:hypothetical protein
MAREIAEMPEAAGRLLARTDEFAEIVERMCTFGKRRQERRIIEMDSRNDALWNVSMNRCHLACAIVSDRECALACARMQSSANVAGRRQDCNVRFPATSGRKLQWLQC